MPLYQDLIMDQIKRGSEPRVSKSTSTTTAEPMTEGLDPMSLMMMLMMMKMFTPPPVAGPPGGDMTLNPLLGNLFNNPYAQSTQLPTSPSSFSLSQPQGGNDMFAEILMALMGGMGGGAPGLPF